MLNYIKWIFNFPLDHLKIYFRPPFLEGRATCNPLSRDFESKLARGCT